MCRGRSLTCVANPSFLVLPCNRHLSSLPQLDPLLVGSGPNLDSDCLGAGHPARPAWHRAEQVVGEVVNKVLPNLTITAKVSVRLIFPRASTYSQLPWKSNIFWSKLLVGESESELESVRKCSTCNGLPPRLSRDQGRPFASTPTGPQSTDNPL